MENSINTICSFNIKNIYNHTNAHNIGGESEF